MFFFLVCSLTKEKKQRPKYAQLKNDPFIKRYEKADVNVGEWYENAVRQADAVAQAATRYVAWLVSDFILFYFLLAYHLHAKSSLDSAL